MTPKYLRFVQSMALVSSLGGCSASSLRVDNDTGLPDSNTSETDVTDTNLADARTCTDCVCGQPQPGNDSRPNCDSIGLVQCCLAVGPLAPPDVPV